MSGWRLPGGSEARALEPRGGWTCFAAGAAVGVALGWLVHGLREGKGGPRGGEEDPGAHTDSPGRPPHRGAGTWEAVMARLDEARAALIRAEALDVEAVARRVAAEPGGDDVRVRELGPGIIELVGRARDPATGVRLAALAAAQPGVDSVVNRIWTATSEP